MVLLKGKVNVKVLFVLLNGYFYVEFILSIWL